MWRKEIWHPVTVHFPIALLLVATFALLTSFFLKEKYKVFFQNITFLLVIVGCVGAWISLFTGDIADGIVSRKICDPTLLKDHEIAAQIMTYLFTSAALISVLYFFYLYKFRFKDWSLYLILVLMLIGSGYLIKAGHLGATLVYEQGAGVSRYSVDCND